VFPTFALGGSQRRTVDLANAFGGRQAHTVVALDGDLSASAQFSHEVAVGYRDVPVRACSGLDLANLQRLRELIRSERPDLLLTYNFGALEAALANRLWPLCPHIHFEDGFGPEEAAGRQLPRRVWMRRVALSGGSLIVVPSRTLERIALERWRLSPRRVRYIPNGVDVARYDHGGVPPPPPWRHAGELVVGSVGGLRPEKNHARLLRVFAKLAVTDRPVRLVLVGEGPERPHLERLSHDLGLADRVTFTGFLADPRPALWAFDVFALTSDTEQMPYSVVEAMACGLPVVGTDVGDVAEMLPNRCKEWVVDLSDEGALAAKIQSLLSDFLLRRVSGRHNKVHAISMYSFYNMLNYFESILNSQLQQGILNHD
jgi:glycosyltransferase involved in cell wall biosynthesis